ncbi:hypothetical protein F5Y03DRAFT_139357 [Xylaria venustula]|nr:hypothetical protein F5Y03DRAFT_139357 [Xylaria venustula]
MASAQLTTMISNSILIVIIIVITTARNGETKPKSASTRRLEPKEVLSFDVDRLSLLAWEWLQRLFVYAMSHQNTILRAAHDDELMPFMS